MAGGGAIQHGQVKQYEGNITPFVIITCLVAAMGGLIFGYDIGISGGVTSMEVFLKKFFPEVYKKQENSTGKESAWCKFDSQLLQLFTSSLYIAALVSSFVASVVTRKFGRKVSMFLGGLIFLVGALLNGVAMDLAMLIIGRILLGIGVGFANQSIPVYLSEMAPANIRGALNIGFQLAITIGILVANLINYGTAKIKGGYGWRVSLGLAGVPAVMMVIGAILLPDTPNSLIERGKPEKARQMLQKIRGTDNVDEEYQDLIDASKEAQMVNNAWKNIMNRRYRPQLVITVLIPFFQQLTGINVIMFYAPVLFKTIGFGADASLMSAVITGLVNVVATFVSVFTVDKFGRRLLFLEGGAQMLVCQVIVGAILGAKFGSSGEGSLSKGFADFVLFLICMYVAAFAWSWGPLGWLVPSEISPLEIRSAGNAINVSVNMFFTFIIAQLFLTMLCHMKFGIFYFFAAFVIVMTAFVYCLVPETKNVPIEEMILLWREHWFWGKFVLEDDDHGLQFTNRATV